MPGKSRQRKGKRSFQSKKKKSSPSRAATVAWQPAAAQTHEPVSSPNVSVPSANVPISRAKPDAVQNPYIATELWTIGILAGIMLIILVVLAKVLS